MRGKLRDKRAAGRRDVFKREVLERRRPYKRDSRVASRLGLENENELIEIEIVEEDEELDDDLPQVK